MRLLASGLIIAQAAADSPIDKVTKLIKDLRAKALSDGEESEKAYNKYACWCENTTTRKGKAIEDGKEATESLMTQVLLLKGKMNTNKAEIKRMNTEIKEAKEEMEEKANIYNKENTESEKEMEEMSETLNALDRALNVLGGQKTYQTAIPAKKETLLQITDLLAATTFHSSSDKSAEVVRRFMSFADEGFAPQSDTIIGILRDMYNTFADNLQVESSEVMARGNTHETFLQTTRKQLKQLNESLTKEEAKLAENTEKHSAAKTEYDDKTKKLKEDAEFFKVTKKNCIEKSDAWTKRKENRKSELEGIDAALKVLEDPKNRTLFRSSIPSTETSFMQVRQMSTARRARGIAEQLRHWAGKTKSMRLALLAGKLESQSGQAGAFKKVIDEIKKMMTVLDEEGKTDDEQNQECIKDRHEANEKVAKQDHKVEVHETKINAIDAALKKNKKQQDDNAEQHKQADKDLDEATKTRDAEHEKFMKDGEEDETAVKLLDEVRGHLTKYHDDLAKAKTGFLQADPEFAVSEDQAPVMEFKPLDNNKMQNAGVVSLIENIMGELQRDLKNSQTEEAHAHLAYVDFKDKTEKMMDQLKVELTNLKKTATTLDDRKDKEGEGKKDSKKKIEDQEEVLKKMKEGCDWIGDNIEKRRELRAAEKKGLRQAMQLLQGMAIPKKSFLQQ